MKTRKTFGYICRFMPVARLWFQIQDFPGRLCEYDTTALYLCSPDGDTITRWQCSGLSCFQFSCSWTFESHSLLRVAVRPDLRGSYPRDVTFGLTNRWDGPGRDGWPDPVRSFVHGDSTQHAPSVPPAVSPSDRPSLSLSLSLSR